MLNRFDFLFYSYIINKMVCEKKSFSSPETGSVCPVCGKRFPKETGKIYCSK